METLDRMNRTALVSLLATAALSGTALVAHAQSPAPASPAATVHIKNFAYAPSPVTVKTGDTVLFINDDQVAHTVTATDSKSFDSGNMDQSAKWKFTFAKAGTYQYLCTYHTYMKGSVVVQD
jgi:plastocyanin